MRDVSESGAWGRRRAHALALFFFAITVVKSCRRQKTHVPQANLHARTAWCRQLFHRPGHNKVRIVGDTVARKRWCLIKQCREGISLLSTTGRHTNGQYLHHGDLSSKLVHQLRGNSRVGCPPQYSSAQQSTRIDAVGGAVPELQTWAYVVKHPQNFRTVCRSDCKQRCCWRITIICCVCVTERTTVGWQNAAADVMSRSSTGLSSSIYAVQRQRSNFHCSRILLVGS